MLTLKNKSFERAYRKGRSARVHGEPRSANPYRRSAEGFGPTFRAYWDRGWRDQDKELRVK